MLKLANGKIEEQLEWIDDRCERIGAALAQLDDDFAKLLAASQ